uniref:cytochrome c oxidase subunit II n=1 Tax=Apachyus feae TaxID=2914707 RepID=UPI001EF9D5DC|nr:cytochrome c oxidase subunit II [Apachyus feae]UKE80563.1 cytochrome c oxidase subunit II [Apachyus feae]
MALWSDLGFQNSAAPLMEQLIFFHDHTLFILLMITVMIGYILGSLMLNSYLNRFLLEGQSIEVVWTMIPAMILLFVAFPSLRLLYLLDEVSGPSLTLKVVGHQWYWSYEYTDFADIEFDSFMVPSMDLGLEGFRLLDVDNNTVVPVNSQVRVLVTAADVIHSWAVPAMGVKIDATPGRLNQTSFFANRAGVFYGQCSEICGANHSFMPIAIESTSLESFVSWLRSHC